MAIHMHAENHLRSSGEKAKERMTNHERMKRQMETLKNDPVWQEVRHGNSLSYTVTEAQ
jgi:hypothetical protein